MNNFPYNTTLVIGDWSDDGHGKTDVVVIASNLDSEEIMEAYDKASEVLGFDLINDFCNDYEDRSFPSANLRILIEHGLILEKVFTDDYELNQVKEKMEEEDVFLWHKSYTQLFLFIIGLGNSEFKYKIVDNEARINLGGYGLFS